VINIARRMRNTAKSKNHEQKTESDEGSACIEDGWGEWVESRWDFERVRAGLNLRKGGR